MNISNSFFTNDPQEITICTYNVGYECYPLGKGIDRKWPTTPDPSKTRTIAPQSHETRYQEIAHFLNQVHPSIIALQEVSVKASTVFQDVFLESYRGSYAQHPTRPDGIQTFVEGNCYFEDEPKIQEIDLKGCNKAGLITTFKTPTSNITVTIINTHLSSGPNHNKGDVETRNALQAADLALANGSDVAFVVGDWNQSGVDALNTWGTRMANGRLTDRIKDIAEQEFGFKEHRDGSYSTEPFDKAGFRRNDEDQSQIKQIDHILYKANPGIEIAPRTIPCPDDLIDLGLSDHLPWCQVFKIQRTPSVIENNEKSIDLNDYDQEAPFVIQDKPPVSLSLQDQSIDSGDEKVDANRDSDQQDASQNRLMNFFTTLYNAIASCFRSIFQLFC